MLGVVVTSALAFYTVYLQFRAFGSDVWISTYPAFEFKFVVALIALVNVYYIAYYHRAQLALLLADLDKRSSRPQQHGTAKELLLIETPARNIPVRQSDIAYAFLMDGACFVCTFQMESVQQAHTAPKTLRELERELDPDRFFRINRQAIISLDAIRSFGPGKGRTLELVIQPAPFEGSISGAPDAYARICTVSEDRAQAFREWMDR